MRPGVFCDYIAREIEDALSQVTTESSLVDTPILKEISPVSASESNYATGPLTKTVYVEDVFGTKYKVSIEDLKHVQNVGWVTYDKAEKLDVHYDRDLKCYVVSTPEYKEQIKKERLALRGVER